MNKHFIIALATLVTSFAVQAAEPATAPITTLVKPASAAPAASTSVPQKTAAISQQDRMRDCNKQATGKKGAERKTFMKTCLSRKA